MSRSPLQRIAFVKLSDTPNGKSYPMRCVREDLAVGDAVEVLMRAGERGEYYTEGVITEISHERWSCSCHVLHHMREISFSALDGELIRTVAVNSA